MENILNNFMAKLDKKIDDNVISVCEEVLQSIEDFKKELKSSLNGSARATKRARVQSIDLDKKLRDFRKTTVEYEKISRIAPQSTQA